MICFERDMDFIKIYGLYWTMNQSKEITIAICIAITIGISIAIAITGAIWSHTSHHTHSLFASFAEITDMGLFIIFQSLFLLIVAKVILPKVDRVEKSVTVFASLLEPFPCMSWHPFLLAVGAPEVTKALSISQEVFGFNPLPDTVFVGGKIRHINEERHNINDKIERQS